MANPTTNFGWVMPTSASLVTNLPADFNTFGQAVDTSMAQLKGGTTGQILSKTSATDMAFTWITNDVGDITAVTAGTGISGGGTSGAVTITNSMATEITAKGDLIAGTGSATFDNLPVGTNGQTLVADSTASTGLKWATPASGATAAGTAVYLQSSQTISNNTDTFIGWDSESFDTDGYHDNATNNSRFTVPAGKAGKYLLNCQVQFGNNSTGNRFISVAKNGATGGSRLAIFSFPAQSGEMSINVSFVVNAAVADYYGFYVAQTSGGNLNINGNGANTMATTASFMYLGA